MWCNLALYTILCISVRFPRRGGGARRWRHQCDRDNQCFVENCFVCKLILCRRTSRLPLSLWPLTSCLYRLSSRVISLVLGQAAEMPHIRCPWHTYITCNVTVPQQAIGSQRTSFLSNLDIAAPYRRGHLDRVPVLWTQEHVFMSASWLFYGLQSLTICCDFYGFVSAGP